MYSSLHVSILKIQLDYFHMEWCICQITSAAEPGLIVSHQARSNVLFNCRKHMTGHWIMTKFTQHGTISGSLMFEESPHDFLHKHKEVFSVLWTNNLACCLLTMTFRLGQGASMTW